MILSNPRVTAEPAGSVPDPLRPPRGHAARRLRTTLPRFYWVNVMSSLDGVVPSGPLQSTVTVLVAGSSVAV